MTEEPKELHFPHYPPPAGLPVAHPTQSKPLYKVMRMMLKPRSHKPVARKSRRNEKKVRYY